MKAETIIIVLLAYLIGSIPFAYLLAKWSGGLDLRKEGTGNIGARNVYEVTNRKGLGITVLLLDLLKGTVPMILISASRYSGQFPWVAGAIILGHCYPVWLKFHGGRGLATAAGILLAVDPALLVIWLTAYWLASRIRDNVHVDSLAALLIVGGLVWIVPSALLQKTILGIGNIDSWELRWGISAIVVITSSRHVGAVLQLRREG
jgi:glycerol-3-phosphate acyltransferase PlsY